MGGTAIRIYQRSAISKALRQSLRKYDLSLDEYYDIFEAQRGTCAICGQPERLTWDYSTESAQAQRLAIDHDHTTGKVRGLLCRSCNTALGGFRDNIDYLEQAIVYLRQHQRAE